MAFKTLSQGRGWWSDLVSDLDYLKVKSMSRTDGVTALNGWSLGNVIYDMWSTNGHNIYAMHGNFIPVKDGGMYPTAGSIIAQFPLDGLAGTHQIMQNVIPMGVDGSGPATMNAYLHPETGKLDLYNNIAGYKINFKSVDIFILMIS